MQLRLFDEVGIGDIAPFRGQLLKWVGNSSALLLRLSPIFRASLAAILSHFLAAVPCWGRLPQDAPLGLIRSGH